MIAKCSPVSKYEDYTESFCLSKEHFMQNLPGYDLVSLSSGDYIVVDEDTYETLAYVVFED